MGLGTDYIVLDERWQFRRNLFGMWSYCGTNRCFIAEQRCERQGLWYPYRMRRALQVFNIMAILTDI